MSGPAYYSEAELLPISGLQHLIYCERQFALIHIERLWADNHLTADGKRFHERVERPETEKRGEIRIARSVSLRSLRLGLVGRADVIEFVLSSDGAPILNLSGKWRLFPVEYKRGRPKRHRADEVQLCAQAICLEEMLGVGVPSGALFYGKVRRRLEVVFDEELRDLVERAAFRAHALYEQRVTPRSHREPQCDKCSLLELCKPDAGTRSARSYVADWIRDATLDDLREGGR